MPHFYPMEPAYPWVAPPTQLAVGALHAWLEDAPSNGPFYLDLSILGWGGHLTLADLSAVLRHPRARHLWGLRMDGQRLGPPLAEEILAWDSLPVLRTLHLNSNELGPEGAHVLAGGIARAALNDLGIAHNQLGPEGLRAILGSPGASTLIRLDVTSNELGDDGLIALAHAHTITALRYLAVSGNSARIIGSAALLSSPVLANLRGLNYGGMYAFPGQAIAAYLARSSFRTTIEALHLGEFNLDGETAQVLFGADGFPALQVLDLATNALGPEGAAVLAHCSLPALEQLNLHFNHLEDAGVRALLNGLPRQRLRVLILSDNGLTDDALQVVAAADSLSGLEVLDLSRNAVSADAIRACTNRRMGLQIVD